MFTPIERWILSCFGIVVVLTWIVYFLWPGEHARRDPALRAPQNDELYLDNTLELNSDGIFTAEGFCEIAINDKSIDKIRLSGQPELEVDRLEHETVIRITWSEDGEEK